MNVLYLITARGGSKGIPHKNIRPLQGKPLIYYSIEVARALSNDAHICVSTDDAAIINVVKACGLSVPFTRPAGLATDTAGSYEVIQHALQHYEAAGKTPDVVVLLQPTSPFRTAQHVKEALALFSGGVDMVVSVKEPEANPYYNLFEEDAGGHLKLSKPSAITRRQDAPKVYQFNGAIYIISVDALKKYKSFGEFKAIVKYEMPALASLDIDTPQDWLMAETLLEKGYVL